jgi:hypothetical protein
MNQQLTQKQITARAYYQENRDRILAQKRVGYEPKQAKPAVIKVPNIKPVTQKPTVTKADIEWDGPSTNAKHFNGVINPGSEFSDRKAINKAITAQGKANLAARRCAEDIRLARELGINLEDIA